MKKQPLLSVLGASVHFPDALAAMVLGVIYILPVRYTHERFERPKRGRGRLPVALAQTSSGGQDCCRSPTRCVTL